jgi:hypothetical protein
MDKNKCMLCGCYTNGSVGAAGIKWNTICQPCKDTEDAILEGRAAMMAGAMRFVAVIDLENNK